MTRDDKGFSLVEALIASSIVFMIALSFVPMITLMNSERELQSLKRNIGFTLHDDIQPFLKDSSNPIPFEDTKIINNKEVTFSFTREDNQMIKGCANWKDGRKEEHYFCIYGIQE